MKHYWKDLDGTLVFINSNDDVTALAWINQVDGKYLLKLPGLSWERDIKDTKNASSYESLGTAKKAAEDEVARRIAEFISPAN